MRSYRIYLIFDNPVLLYGRGGKNRLQAKNLVINVVVLVGVAYILCIGKASSERFEGISYWFIFALPFPPHFSSLASLGLTWIHYFEKH